MREEPRPIKNNHVQNTSIKVNIESVPRMGRVSELQPNDVFFSRRCSSMRIVVGDNIYAKDIKEKWEKKDEKKLVVYYDLSQKHIGTIDADEWVVFGNKLKVEVI